MTWKSIKSKTAILAVKPFMTPLSRYFLLASVPLLLHIWPANFSGKWPPWGNWYLNTVYVATLLYLNFWATRIKKVTTYPRSPPHTHLTKARGNSWQWGVLKQKKEEREEGRKEGMKKGREGRKRERENCITDVLDYLQ